MRKIKDSWFSSSTMLSMMLAEKYLPYVIFAGLLIFGGLSYFAWQAVENIALQISEEERMAQERAELQERLDVLYASEGVPTATGDNDLFNYGLEDSATGTPSGILSFTGRDPKVLPQMSIYFLDVETQSMYIPTFLQKNNLFVFSEFTSNSKPEGLFLNAISSAATNESQYSQLGVHRYNLVEDTFKYLKSADGPSEARGFEWSESSKFLAFTRLKKPFETFIDMGDITHWETVIIDPETDKLISVIDSATDPEWSPDGTKLVYLKSDGLYLYNIETRTDTLIHTVNEGKKVISTSMIDISPDGQYLIWTVGGHSLIIMNRIESWDDFSMAEVGRITVPNTYVIWPQFSPDSQFYAVQAIDLPEEGSVERKNPRFEIRPTLGREVVRTFPTDAFSFTEFHTDDWIEADPADIVGSASVVVEEVEE